MQDDGLVSESVAEHAAILASLQARDRRKAVRLLRSHWDRCTEATLADFRAKVDAARGDT
jgi:DNA-binding GntR family transcriptional regulator